MFDGSLVVLQEERFSAGLPGNGAVLLRFEGHVDDVGLLDRSRQDDHISVCTVFACRGVYTC